MTKTSLEDARFTWAHGWVIESSSLSRKTKNDQRSCMAIHQKYTATSPVNHNLIFCFVCKFVLLQTIHNFSKTKTNFILMLIVNWIKMIITQREGCLQKNAQNPGIAKIGLTPPGAPLPHPWSWHSGGVDDKNLVVTSQQSPLFLILKDGLSLPTSIFKFLDPRWRVKFSKSSIDKVTVYSTCSLKSHNYDTPYF